MKSIRSFFFVLTCSVVWMALMAPTAFGQHHERKVFDNWNTAVCDSTDRAVFTLDRPMRVNRIEVWYRWHAREESIGFTLAKRGKTLVRGTLVRSECDPYQEKWCVAVNSPNLWLQPGRYHIRTERPRICQNSESSGNGFVKVYGKRH